MSKNVVIFFTSHVRCQNVPKKRAPKNHIAASGHATREAFGAAAPAVRSAPWAEPERRRLSLIVPINFLCIKTPTNKQTKNGKATWGLLQPTCALRAASSYCKQLRGFALRWPLAIFVRF